MTSDTTNASCPPTVWPGEPFTLKELLHEMTTAQTELRPVCDCSDWDCMDCERSVAVFHSQLAKGYLRTDGVLALIQCLYCPELDGKMQLEQPGVLLYRGRRFHLSGDRAHELCAAPSCELSPLEFFDWCQSHLCEQDERRLLHAASDWGYANHRDTGVAPGQDSDNHSVRPLVRAAVRQGCFTAVLDQIMKSAFFDVDEMESHHHDSQETLAYRYVYERERLQLEEAAGAVGWSLHQEARECQRCARPLVGFPWTFSRRPGFCSAECDLADRPAPEARDCEEPPF